MRSDFGRLLVFDEFLDQELDAEEGDHAQVQVQVVCLFGQLLVGPVYQVQQGSHNSLDEIRHVWQREVQLVSIALFNKLAQNVQRRQDHLRVRVINRKRYELHHCNVRLLVLNIHVF